MRVGMLGPYTILERIELTESQVRLRGEETGKDQKEAQEGEKEKKGKDNLKTQKGTRFGHDARVDRC